MGITIETEGLHGMSMSHRKATDLGVSQELSHGMATLMAKKSMQNHGILGFNF